MHSFWHRGTLYMIWHLINGSRLHVEISNFCASLKKKITGNRWLKLEYLLDVKTNKEAKLDVKSAKIFYFVDVSW